MAVLHGNGDGMKLKNLLISLGLGVIFMGLVSCGEQASNENAQNIVEYTGVLQHVVSTDAPTPYMFINDDATKSAVYLESPTINLDKFINEEIVLRGYQKDESVFFVTDAWNKTQDNSNADSAKGTYSDAVFGIAFSYPSTWMVNKKDARSLDVLTKDKQEKVFTMYSVDLDSNQSLDEWVAKNFKGKESSSTTIGIMSGLYVKNGDVEEYVFESGKTLYVIEYGYKQENGERLFSEVLTSMRVFTTTMIDENSNTNDGVSGDNTNTSQVSSANENISTVGVDNENSNVMLQNNNGNQVTSAQNQNANSTINSETENSSQKDTTTETKITAPAVVAEVTKHPDLLPADNTPTISQVELAGNNYVYVTYMDGETKKKVLLQYASSGSGYSFTQVGAFVEGVDTSWEKVSGNNAAYNQARDVYDVSNGGVTEKSSVKEGQSLYTNKYLDFNVEYPRNWYYAGENISSEGGLQKVTFSDQPLSDDPANKVEIEVYNKGTIDTSGASQTTIGGKTAYVIQDPSGTQKYVIEGSDGKQYVTDSTGGAESQQVLQNAIETLDK